MTHDLEVELLPLISERIKITDKLNCYTQTTYLLICKHKLEHKLFGVKENVIN